MVRVSQILLFFILLLSYLKIHGAGIVFVAALAFSLMVYFRYRSAWSAPALYIIGLSGFLVLHTILTQLSLPSFYGFGKDQAKIALYSVTNVCIIVTSLYLISRAEPSSHRGAVYWVMVAMIVVGAMEAYGPIKPMVDVVRSLYTSEFSIYAATERDLAQYGAVRPSVFTSEPSSVGNFFGALWLCYICTIKVSMRRFVNTALLLFALALYVFRSPTLVGYLAVAPGLLLVKSGRPVAGYLSLIVVLFGVLLAPNLLWLMKSDVEPASLRRFLSTGSFFIRQISPYIAVSSAMEVSPIFGAGPSYYQLAREETAGMLSYLFGGFYTDSRLAEMPDGQFVTNATWEFVGTFGIAGCAILAFIFLRMFRTFRISHGAAILLACASLWVSHAGIVGAFTWTPLILLALAFRINVDGDRKNAHALPA